MADRRGIAGLGGITLALVVLAPLAGCTSGGEEVTDAVRKVDAARLVHLSATDKVDPSQPVTVTAEPGSRLTDVTVVGPDGRIVAGRLSEDQRSWQTTGRLKAATAYTVRIAAADGSGGRGETTSGFATVAAQRLLTAKLGPDSSGSGVYGVGQPLTVQLSEAVKDPQARQEVERALTVTSQPAVTGAWYWVDDKNLHFRPEAYWPTGTVVALAFEATGGRISDGLYGGDRAALAMRIGERVETVVDAAAHELTLKRDGQVVRTIPVTTGKPGFDTRNGVKVVLGRAQGPDERRDDRHSGRQSGVLRPRRRVGHPGHLERRVRARGALVGRLPGVENVSHGCTGMSTENAHWFYQNTRVGDLVTVVNSRGRNMEPFGNGFGDWNIGWGEWVGHSALGQPVSTTTPATRAPAGGMIAPQL